MNDLLEKNEIPTEEAEIPSENENKNGSEKPKSRKKLFLILFSCIFGFLCLCVFLIFAFVRPVFEYGKDGDIKIQIGSENKYPECKIKYLCFDMSDKVTVSGDLDTQKFGEYPLKYTISVFGKKYNSEKKVIVLDEIPPEITLEGETEITLSKPEFFEETGYSAKDGFDGNLTNEVLSALTCENGEYSIEYSVKDSSGNIGTAKRKLIIKDVIPPVLTLNGESEIFLNVPEFSEPGYSATDDADGEISEKVVIESDYAAYTEGDFVFTYSVCDSAGNKAEAKRIIHVKDDVAPIMTVNGSDIQYILVGETFADKGAYAVDAFEGDLTSKIVTQGEVDPSVPGQYTLQYICMDSKENTVTKTRTVRVFERNQYVEGAVNGQGIVSDSTIYLTFDDGPSNRVTPRVLDILKANNIKATFFIINYSEANKLLIQRMINEGHTIGIHGYSHDFTVYSSVDSYLYNINTLREKLKNDFGYDTNIIRFLGGSSNTISRNYCNGVMSKLCPIVEQLGYTYFDWNVSSGDADVSTAPRNTIINNVTKGVRKNRGNVVLMHDINTKTTTADALQNIINYGLANGYTFAGLSSYTPPVHHNVLN